MYMASGVSGGAGAVAVHHVGPGYNSIGGGVTAPLLDLVAGTALARKSR